MVNFIIPGLYEHYDLNFTLLKLMQNHPEFFRENVQISAVYGNFQMCIFDGGRIFSVYRQTTKEEIEKIVSTYNQDFNIPVRLVCTNTELTPDQYKNRFGNLILSLCENELNEIVVNQDGFASYIKENYPEYTFVSSTTKCLNTPNLLKQELKKEEYKMVCLDYNLNKNWKMLNSLNTEEKSKCEFLCNAICPPGCINRKEHYRLNSLFHLNYGKQYVMENCPIQNSTIDAVTINACNTITPEDIYEKYYPNGFNLFKLEGRTLSLLENAINYARYLGKPEHQWTIINCLVEEEPSFKILKASYAYGR